jgi:hypothetical protein
MLQVVCPEAHAGLAGKEGMFTKEAFLEKEGESWIKR